MTEQDLVEAGLLGILLRDPNAIHDVYHLVREGDFRAFGDRKIFAAIASLWNDNKPIEMTAVADYLHTKGHLEDVGGCARIGTLHEEAPTSANAGYYATLIRDRSMMRQLESVGNQIALDARDPADAPDAILEKAEKAIFRIAQERTSGQVHTIRECVDRAMDRIDARTTANKSISGIATGFVDLDRLTAGLQDSELTVLAARPGVGKTSLALDIARHVAKLGYPVFFASLEQGDIELAERLICAEAQVDSQRLRRGIITPEEAQRIGNAEKVIKELRITVDDSPAQSMFQIAANARRLASRGEVRVVVVDYLQLVEAEDRRVPRHEQVSAISRRLKQLAREIKAPVLALAQLNRAVEARADGAPKLSDLRESGGIEADADTVILMNRPNTSPNTVVLNVAKQRNGPTGEVILTFRSQFTSFDNHAIGDCPFDEPVPLTAP